MLQELKQNLEAAKTERTAYLEGHKRRLAEYDRYIERAAYEYDLAVAGVDMHLFAEAEKYILICGVYKGAGDDNSAIEDAIKWFADSLPEKWKDLRTGYFGCKNYDRWHHQREDHPYGYGPRHGSTVFAIELRSEHRKAELSPEAKHACIYYLEMLKAGKLSFSKAA
jgi:hypothetical protein